MSSNVFLTKWSEISGQRFDSEYFKPDILLKIKKLKNQKTSIHLKNELIELCTGFNSEQNDDFQGIKFLRTQNIKQIKLDIEQISYTDSLDVRISHIGDLLFTRIGAKVGNVSYNDIGDFAVSDNVIVARFKNNRFSKYLAILFATDIGKSLLERGKRDTARPIISYENITNLWVPYLTNKKQQTIIDIIEQAYKQKQQKENEAKKLLDSIDEYLLKELGIDLPKVDESDISKRVFLRKWSEISGDRFDPFYNNIIYSKIDNKIEKGKFNLESIKNLSYGISGVIYSRQDEREQGKGILRANNITLETNELNFNDIKYIRDDFEISEKLLLKANDILMSSASGSKEHVGKVAFIEEELNYYFGGFMMVLRQKNNNYLQKYLFEFLQSKIFRIYLFKNLGGTNINNLSFNMISHLQVPLPALLKQEEIVSHITNIREQAKLLKQQAIDDFEKAKKEVEGMLLGEIDEI